MEEVRDRIRQLAAMGSFGAGKLLEIKSDTDEGKGAQFMSEIMFFQLCLLEGSTRKERKIFVKIQLKDNPRTIDFSTDIQFANEVAMYNTILPELDEPGIGVYPKIIYGNATNGKAMKKDMIVMEDLRPSGYKIAENLWLGKDHVMLTVRALGKYHGLSYKFKSRNPKRLEEFAQMLQSRQFKMADGFFEGSLYRGFASMIDDTVADRAYKKLCDILVDGNGKSLSFPEEPFALISHGDFNKNNLLYKYDDNGKVVDVKFIDFANSLYSDAAIDLSFFLYMNTSEESRRTHWNDFLQAYWEGVTSITLPVFTYDQFLEHFAQRAIWGYIPCCFFLPLMMFPEALQEKNEPGSAEEKWKLGMTSGGEEATTAVTNITKHLLDMGYLKAFADQF